MSEIEPWIGSPPDRDIAEFLENAHGPVADEVRQIIQDNLELAARQTAEEDS